MLVGMWMFASVGMFQQKGLRAMQVRFMYPYSLSFRVAARLILICSPYFPYCSMGLHCVSCAHFLLIPDRLLSSMHIISQAAFSQLLSGMRMYSMERVMWHRLPRQITSMGAGSSPSSICGLHCLIETAPETPLCGLLPAVQDPRSPSCHPNQGCLVHGKRRCTPEALLLPVQILPLAAAFVGYIVFWNLSLQLNSVGFYQLSKILIAPAIILIEAVWFKKVPTRMELAAVALLCIGVTLATVSDSEVGRATLGISLECAYVIGLQTT